MGKKLLVTGATHGIGKCVSEKFLGEGWEVYGCGSNKDDVRGRQMEEVYSGFHFKRADISNEKEVAELIDACRDMEAAFNNAGIGCAPRAFHLMDLDMERRILDVNLFGTALCMKYEIAAMLEGGGGIIINNSSVSAYKAATGASAIYSASKAGILRLTKEAAVMQIYRERIKFFSLVPGWVETRMTAMDDKKNWENILPAGKGVMPEKVAELVYTMVVNAADFESGQEFHISGGGILL